jgi:hypothetical protein
MTIFVGLFDTVYDYTLQYTVAHTRMHLHCCCLLVASNGGRSLSSGFLICPWPRLPTSNCDSSQRLNHSSPLTNSLNKVKVTLWLSVSQSVRVQYAVQERHVVIWVRVAANVFRYPPWSRVHFFGCWRRPMAKCQSLCWSSSAPIVSTAASSLGTSKCFTAVSD